MKFRFEFDVKKLPWPISHVHKMMLLGSCFTENIGEKLKRYKFQVLENPHGILFNPVSVSVALDDYINNKQYSEADLFYLNEGWHSWHHHSRFSGITAGDSVQKINTAIYNAHTFLKKADYLLVTLGSSWVYELTSKAQNAKPGAVAANNHKAPADWFERRLLAADEVLNLLRELLSKLKSFNTDLKVIFTISPVRHLREGVIDNNRSKAVLIQSVHNIISEVDNAYYFPAYEIVLDDLRDYRFYAEDLVHPNYFATEYVWKKFINASVTDDTLKLMEELHTIHLAFNHKAFNPTSEQHKSFLKTNKEKVERLTEKYPYLDLEKEYFYFSTASSNT